MTLKMLVTPIKAVLGFPKLAPKDLLASATAIHTGMSGNPAYPNPPVEMAGLKADIDNFSSAITASQDGGKKAIVERNRLAEVLIKKLRKLGKYVEISCNDDMKTFLSSGFEPASVARPSAPALSGSIRRIKVGPNTGQFLVAIAAVPGAHSYELRCGVVGAGGSLPSAWMTQPAGKTRPPALITGLTPGANYAIQVRAVTKAGYTDWSDPVTRICT
jgi:Fibronectin type III domain